MSDLNLMVWGYVGYIGMAISGVYAIMTLYARDKLWQCSEAADATACSEVAVAEGYLDDMEWEMLKEMTLETAHAFELWKEHKSWMWAQWLNLDDETKIAMAEAAQAEMAEKMEEKMEEEEEETEPAESEMFAF